MSVDNIRSSLVEVLNEIQAQSGRAVGVISDELRPLGDLEGFDSLNAEEAAALLSDRLGLEIEENPFISAKGKALSVGDVAKRLSLTVDGKQKGKRS